MKRKLILILILFLSLIVFPQSYKYQVVKLKSHNNLLFTKVTFNGEQCYLLVDSGASKSVLDINKAIEYGFKFITSIDTSRRYIGLGGITDIYIVYDYKIEEYHVNFLGSDLHYINEYLKKEKLAIIGVLGGDFLNRHNVQIDYKKKIMYIK